MSNQHTPSRRSLPALLAGLLLGIGSLSPALAATAMAPDDAVRFIRGVADDALAVVGDTGGDAQRVRKLIDSHVAIDFIGRFGMGKHWRDLGPDERERYLALYREFFLHRYAGILGGYQGRDLTVTGAKPAGDQDVLVGSRVRNDEGEELPADWRVRMIDGKPKIVDIVIEGVSVAVNQRQEFTAVVERDGFAGLMEMLRGRASG